MSDIEIDIDADDPTPVTDLPCRECGSDLTLVPDDEPAPTTRSDAYGRAIVCIATRDHRWSWCPRTGWLHVCFDSAPNSVAPRGRK